MSDEKTRMTKKTASKKESIETSPAEDELEARGDHDGDGDYGPKKLDRAQVVDLATRLVSAQIASIPVPQEMTTPLPLDNEFYNELFDGAIRRAETILRGPDVDIHIVFAEQLFRDDEAPMSDEDIRARFIGWEWPKLMGRKTVVKLMNNIESWLVEHLQQRQETLENLYGRTSTAETAFVRALFAFCERRTERVMQGPWPSSIERLAQHIPPLVEEWCASSRCASEDPGPTAYDNAWHEELVRWCLGDRDPVDPFQSRKYSAAKYYRPWSLFRYIRVCDSEVKAIADLRTKLLIQSNNLGLKSMPNRLLETNPYDFPEFNRMFEKRTLDT